MYPYWKSWKLSRVGNGLRRVHAMAWIVSHLIRPKGNSSTSNIVDVSTPEHAAKYARELQAEIMTLRYLAGIIPVSRYRSVRHYHPHAKQLRTRNKQLNIIFHVEGNLAIVDKILASKMIIN